MTMQCMICYEKNDPNQVFKKIFAQNTGHTGQKRYTTPVEINWANQSHAM